MNHGQQFVLDRGYQATCQACHQDNDFSRYTGYGCHEHTQASLRAAHLEEGIRNFETCVECQRDPCVEPEKEGGRWQRRHEKD